MYEQKYSYYELLENPSLSTLNEFHVNSIDTGISYACIGFVPIMEPKRGVPLIKHVIDKVLFEHVKLFKFNNGFYPQAASVNVEIDDKFLAILYLLTGETFYASGQYQS